MSIDFEWDPDKAAANPKKHGVSFEEAATVFGDPLSLTIPDHKHSTAEERWLTLGRSRQARMIVVAYTERPTAIRIISARPATPHERKQYEEGA